MPSTTPTGYLTAISQALQGEDIPVVDHAATPARPWTVTLRLDPNWAQSSFAGLEALHLKWDETTGWRLIMTYPPTASLRPAPVYPGLSIIPEPTTLAAWTGLVLAYPELVASSANTPGDVPVDTALRRYDTTATPQSAG